MSNISKNVENKDKQRIQDLEMLLKMNSLSQSQYDDDEIDLKELWNAIWFGKWIIIIISALFAVASIVYALSQPNVYKASTLLAPVSTEGRAGGLAELAGQFGGLASLAGINIGGSGTDKVALALEVLKSRKFIEDFIEKNDLLVPLIAVESWDRVNDKLVIDDKLYDVQAKEWVREVSFPMTSEPSGWEAFEAFNEIISTIQDKETGMVTIAIAYYSPELAKQWLTKLIKQLNDTMREQDSKEAKNSINFLTSKLEQTQLADMQNVLYQLIEEQTKTIMLAEVADEYVLKTIDPPNVPDQQDKPKRALIVFLGGILGVMLSTLIVLITYFSKKSGSQ